MVALGRSLSFTRRRSQKTEKKEQEVAVEEPEEPSKKSTVVLEEAAPERKSRVQQIIRSASFGRRGSKKDGGSAKKTKDEPSTTEEESSDSRPITPDGNENDDSKPERKRSASRNDDEKDTPAHEMSDAELDKVPLCNNLQGWLMKRHQKQPHQWGRRFFLVNDERGTIAYSKGEKGKSLKPSVVLSLQDIAVVKLVNLPDSRNPILISCPPVALTVAAEDREEALMWVLQLNKRMRLWKEKAAAKTKVATTLATVNTTPAPVPPPMPPMPPIPTASDPVAAPPAALAAEERLEPRDAVATRERSAGRKSPPHEDEPERRAEDAPKGSRALQQYPPALKQYPADVPVPSEAVREPCDRRITEDAPDVGEHRAPPTMTGASPRVVSRPAVGHFGRSPQVTSIETIDFGDDNEGGSPTAGGRSPDGKCELDPWAMPTRNLADLLSSDEDEDEADDYAPPPARQRTAAAPTRAVVAPKPAARPEPAASRPRPEPAASRPHPEPAASKPHPEPSGTMSWLNAMPDEAFEGEEDIIEPPMRVQQQPPAHVQQQTPAPACDAQQLEPQNDWDSEEEEPEAPVAAPPAPASRAERRAARNTTPPKPEPSPPEPKPEEIATLVGDGIRADNNFVEDDWDTDEE